MFELRDAPRPVSVIGANTVRVEHSTRAHKTRADTMTPMALVVVKSELSNCHPIAEKTT